MQDGNSRVEGKLRSAQEPIPAEPSAADGGIQLNISGLENTVTRLEAVQSFSKTSAIVFVLFLLLFFAVLYVLSRTLFFDLISLLWSWQSALVVIAAAFFAKSVLNRQAIASVRTSIEVTKEIGNGFNIMLGAFRAEIAKNKAEVKQSNAQPTVNDTVDEQDQRVAALEQNLARARKSEQEAQQRQKQAEQSERAARADAAVLAQSQLHRTLETERVALQNWGEMNALWSDAWEWTKNRLGEALEEDRRGVVIANLRNANLKSPRQTIESLLRYGWLNEQEAALTIQMLDLFNSYKLKQQSVDAGALKQFKKLYDKWRNS